MVYPDAPVHHQLQLQLLPPLLPAPAVLPSATAVVVAAVSLVLLPLAEARRGVHLVAVDTSCRTVVVSRRAGHTTSRSRLLLLLFERCKDWDVDEPAVEQETKEEREKESRRLTREEERSVRQTVVGDTLCSVNFDSQLYDEENVFFFFFVSVTARKREKEREWKGEWKRESECEREREREFAWATKKKGRKKREREKKRKGLTSECDEPFRYSLTRTGPHTRARTPREPRRVAGNIACTLSFRGFLPSDVDARRSAGSHAVPPLHRRRVPSGCLPYFLLHSCFHRVILRSKWNQRTQRAYTWNRRRKHRRHLFRIHYI